MSAVSLKVEKGAALEVIRGLVDNNGYRLMCLFFLEVDKTRFDEKREGNMVLINDIWYVLITYCLFLMRGSLRREMHQPNSASA